MLINAAYQIIGNTSVQNIIVFIGQKVIEKSIFNLYNNIENYQKITITNKKGKLIAQEEWIPNLLNWFKLEIDSIKSNNQKNFFDLFKQCIEKIAQNTGKDLDSFKNDFDDIALELKLEKAGKSSSLPTIQTTEAESSVSSRVFLLRLLIFNYAN